MRANGAGSGHIFGVGHQLRVNTVDPADLSGASGGCDGRIPVDRCSQRWQCRVRRGGRYRERCTEAPSDSEADNDRGR
jgi:hypothetical protein